MRVSSLGVILWVVGFFAEALLLTVLLTRARWRDFPVFTLWTALITFRTMALYVLYSRHDTHLYAHVYWISLWPEFLLQVGVAIEIARVVLRPTGTWVRDARGLFFAAAFGGAAVAAILSWWITPAHSRFSAWEMRGDLFTSLVICELFAAMSVTANRMGLGWRNHVMALGQGLTAWSGVMVITTALQSYWGNHDYDGLDQLRIIAYIAATLWIAVQVWRPEPERQPISENLQKYILALHRRVEYDLRRLDAGN